MRAPEGEDLVAWNLLQQRSDGQGWGTTEWGRRVGQEIAPIIWRDHRGSIYAQYAAALLPKPTLSERQAILRDAIAIDPRSVVADQYRLELIYLVISKASWCGSPQQFDLACAARYYAEARPLLQDLATSATSFFVKRHALEKLDEMTERLAQSKIR